MAEDIAQDVMLRLWQMHDELERFRSVEAIVTLMAKHTLRDLQRRRTAESLEEATIVSLTSIPQEELEAKENEEWLIIVDELNMQIKQELLVFAKLLFSD
jgi:RNA polymerase sigma-70 factor (ECF subfamily)